MLRQIAIGLKLTRGNGYVYLCLVWQAATDTTSDFVRLQRRGTERQNCAQRLQIKNERAHWRFQMN